jgi:hypothetical protein
LQTLAIAQGLAQKARANGRDGGRDAAEEGAETETRLQADAGNDTSPNQGRRGSNRKTSGHAKALRRKIQAS